MVAPQPVPESWPSPSAVVQLDNGHFGIVEEDDEGKRYVRWGTCAECPIEVTGMRRPKERKEQWRCKHRERPDHQLRAYVLPKLSDRSDNLPPADRPYPTSKRKDTGVEITVTLEAIAQCPKCGRKLYERNELPEDSVHTGNMTQRAGYWAKAMHARMNAAMKARGWDDEQCARCRDNNAGMAAINEVRR